MAGQKLWYIVGEKRSKEKGMTVLTLRTDLDKSPEVHLEIPTPEAWTLAEHFFGRLQCKLSKLVDQTFPRTDDQNPRGDIDLLI